MLKHRILFGLLFSALFVGLIALDWYAAGDWPMAPWSTPPGLLVAVASVLLIPLALWEMRALLARQNVVISMRITVVAALLCMLWPWLEQVGDSIQQRLTVEESLVHAAGPPEPAVLERVHRLQSSPWYSIGTWFRTVKPHYLVPTILALALVAAVVKHARHRRVEGAMANAGGTLLAIVYLGVLPGFFLPICMTHSAWMMLAIVAIVKSADIGAYATGRMVGRHKLIPWLSPGKTIEGFVGGLVVSGVVGALVGCWMKGSPPVNVQDAERWAHITLPMALLGGGFSGMVLGAVGQVGDLLESLLKRDAGVKDSGAVPGFGGVLDILDSPLLAGPVAYWLLKLLLR